MIPFLDVGASYRELRTEFDAAYHRVMDRGWFILGPEVEAFEQEFAAYTGAKHAISVSNGLDALELLLRAHRIGDGDEVIVPAHTFIATWLAVTRVGARPVPVDVELGSANIDPSLVERAITPKTRAILPVHLYGQPADLDPLLEIARRRSLLVLEDAAQAHGARYRGRSVGTLADGAAFSFYPGKNLGAFGDGGAVTTSDPTIAERVRRLRNYGSSKKYHHDDVGFNARLDELQAAFLRVRLAHLDEQNARRRELAALYRASFARLPQVRCFEPPAWAEPVWHLFVVRHPARDALLSALSQSGIGALIHYPIPPHLSPAYASFGLQRGAFPVTEALASEVLSLPMGPHLPHAQAAEVVAAVERFERETR